MFNRASIHENKITAARLAGDPSELNLKFSMIPTRALGRAGTCGGRILGALHTRVEGFRINAGVYPRETCRE